MLVFLSKKKRKQNQTNKSRLLFYFHLLALGLFSSLYQTLSSLEVAVFSSAVNLSNAHRVFGLWKLNTNVRVKYLD